MLIYTLSLVMNSDYVNEGGKAAGANAQNGFSK